MRERGIKYRDWEKKGICNGQNLWLSSGQNVVSVVSIVNSPWDCQWFFERHKCVVYKMKLCVVCKTHHWESHNSWTNPTKPTLIKLTTTRKKKKRKEANPTPPTAHHLNPRPQTHQANPPTYQSHHHRERGSDEEMGHWQRHGRERKSKWWSVWRGKRGEQNRDEERESWEWKGRRERRENKFY